MNNGVRGKEYRKLKVICDKTFDELPGHLRELCEDYENCLSEQSENTDIRSSELWIEYMYEELLDYQRIRNVRMEDLGKMADEGFVMHVEKVCESPITLSCFPPGGGAQSEKGFHCRYHLLNADRYYSEKMFMAMLVCAEDDRSIDELRSLSKSDEGQVLPQLSGCYDGAVQRIRRIFEVREMAIKVEDGETYVEFDRFCGDDDVEELFSGGHTFYIVERYKDLNKSKIREILKKACDARISGNDRAYLYPESMYKTVEDTFDENCLSYVPDDGKSFTQSQQMAFRQLFTKNITLLLGPPGTGKTDFIARAIITLCRYYNAVGKMMSVLVSANSHSAINNIIDALAGKERGLYGEPKLFRFEKWGDDDEEAIDGVPIAKDYVPKEDKSSVKTSDIYSFRDGIPFVVGSTCWKIFKSVSDYNKKYVPGRFNMEKNTPDEEFDGFDLVVIDEASQVRCMDALLDLHSSLGNSRTRFLIVGDDNQLPPIIQGKYDVAGRDVNIFGSAFRLFYDAAKARGLDYIKPLEEQFRMNEILVRYPAKEIYDTDITSEDSGRNGYHAFDFGGTDDDYQKRKRNIADQKLTFADCPSELYMDYENSPEILRYILDPEFPMVVCNIHGGSVTGRQKSEISIVTDLIKYMRKFMIDPDTITGDFSGITYVAGPEGDRRFWGSSSGDGGVGIVSPHHEQINRLKNEISEKTDMDRDVLYIGTVDKLQGKQREAVIVSYGVSDPEKAAKEMEFIYSRNRLNVAMTRGKKKMICFLSDTLTDYGKEMPDIEDEDTRNGIAFMSNLINFMQEEEADTRCSEPKAWDIGDVHMTVYRKRIAQ